MHNNFDNHSNEGLQVVGISPTHNMMIGQSLAHFLVYSYLVSSMYYKAYLGVMLNTRQIITDDKSGCSTRCIIAIDLVVQEVIQERFNSYC